MTRLCASVLGVEPSRAVDSRGRRMQRLRGPARPPRVGRCGSCARPLHRPGSWDSRTREYRAARRRRTSTAASSLARQSVRDGGDRTEQTLGGPARRRPARTFRSQSRNAGSSPRGCRRAQSRGGALRRSGRCASTRRAAFRRHRRNRRPRAIGSSPRVAAGERNTLRSAWDPSRIAPRRAPRAKEGSRGAAAVRRTDGRAMPDARGRAPGRRRGTRRSAPSGPEMGQTGASVRRCRRERAARARAALEPGTSSSGRMSGSEGRGGAPTRARRG